MGDGPLHEEIIEFKGRDFDGKLAFWVFCIFLCFVESHRCSQKIVNVLEMIRKFFCRVCHEFICKNLKCRDCIEWSSPVHEEWDKKIR